MTHWRLKTSDTYRMRQFDFQFSHKNTYLQLEKIQKWSRYLRAHCFSFSWVSNNSPWLQNMHGMKSISQHPIETYLVWRDTIYLLVQVVSTYTWAPLYIVGILTKRVWRNNRKTNIKTLKNDIIELFYEWPASIIHFRISIKRKSKPIRFISNHITCNLNENKNTKSWSGYFKWND